MKRGAISLSDLEAAIRRHNHLYFIEHQPEISDEEFDHLVEQLRKQKPNSPVLAELGSDLSKNSKTFQHRSPMLSLEKCYNDEDLFHWASKFEGDVIAMPKIDGCAITLHYDAKGRLRLAATRGSGVEGEVITANVFYIPSIPNQISLKNVEVRGEVYMPISIFESYEKEFANPRNLAAGAIKQKDPRKTGEYRLSFLAYDLLGVDCKTEEEKRKFLKKAGIPIVPTKKMSSEKMASTFQVFHKERDSLDFETDGVVFKADRVEQQQKLGFTAHHPRFAIAYKFQGDSGESVVKEILWSVARTGVITPVGVVEPVELSGAMVSRVSLHNYGLAKKTGVGVGAKVLMVRRGGVIPYVESVLEKGKGLSPPQKCPSCGSKIKQEEDFLYCTRPAGCIMSRVGDLEHFVKTMGIDCFGPKLLQKLLEEKVIKDAADLYYLKTENLMPLDRMGETLSKKIVLNVQNVKEPPLDIFLQALGIPELGGHVAGILCGLGDLKKIQSLKEEDLIDLHGIGEKIAKNVVEGLKQKKILIERLLKAGVLPKKIQRISGGPLAGKSFLFTGTLESMDRKVAEKKVTELGGKIISGVSKNLDFLVMGENPGSKRKKAENLGIQILSEREFLERIQ